jgi:ABC-type multidrug transport system ATPase subunit
MRELIERMNQDGLTILLIDHDMRLVMGVCTRVAVLNFGRKIADGTPDEVSTDAGVIKAYLGTGGEREVHSAPGSTGVDEATEVAVAVVGSKAAAEPEMAILDVHDLSVSYGAVNAVRGASLRVAAGEVVALIGANGAGKSTILNTLSGLIRPDSGTARFDGLDRPRPTHPPSSGTAWFKCLKAARSSRGKPCSRTSSWRPGPSATAGRPARRLKR